MRFSTAVFPGAPVRARELGYIVDTLRQNQCCAVVGPSNTGKSFLLKSLLEEEVRQACATQGARPPVMVFVDFLRPVDSEPAFYELLLRCIGSELRRLEVAQPVVDRVREWRRELLRSTTAMAARSWFDEALYALGREHDVRLVLVMDEFDPAFGTLPSAPFQELRVLRDDVGEGLMFVTGTSRHLGHIRSDQGTSEFRELFDLHTLVLRPLCEEDRLRFIAYVEREQGTGLREDHASWAIELSGGHPGLLERICHIFSDVGTSLGSSWDEALSKLIGTWAIQEECRRLWDELEEEERRGLLTLVEGQAGLRVAEMGALLAKGLIRKQRDGGWAVFSPLFGAFVQQRLDELRRGAPHGLRYNAETGQISLDGRDITRELSAEQYALLSFLCLRPGVVRSKDEIAQAVWPEQWVEGITDAQIYQLVKRVREKVEWDPGKPRYIVTVRGRGYRYSPPPI